MHDVKYVADLVAKLKNDGTLLEDAAWQTGLACVGWAYVFGAYGHFCEPSNRRYFDKLKGAEHPTIKSSCRNFGGSDDAPGKCVGCKWFCGNENSVGTDARTRFFDCRGFTRWILKQIYGFTLTGGGATSQWNTKSNWTAQGTIDTIPEDRLVCLFYTDKNNPKVMAHTGLGYKGETLECSSGVQHFTKRNKKWTHWALPVCVSDDVPIPPEPSPEPEPEPSGKKVTIRKGSKGPYVTLLQTQLINQGYSLPKYGADGSFGSETENALKQFQTDHGLEADGICGPRTWEMLESADPAAKELYTVTIPHLSRSNAEKIVETYYPATMTLEQ